MEKEALTLKNPTENQEGEPLSMPTDGLAKRRLIGSAHFELTEKDVIVAILETLRDWLFAQRVLIKGRKSDEKTYHYASQSILLIRARIKALLGPPKKVLQKVRAFYKLVSQLELNKMDQDQIVEEILKEYPNIFDFYPLLRRTKWGYRLGMAITSYNNRKNLDAKKERQRDNDAAS
ncbi:MAG: hypothetical protein NC935_06175 [Candidatus Omnitrophica bacterium]|nr:hypothetical protein [Candidatus Omnitrophota bacterium]